MEDFFFSPKGIGTRKLKLGKKKKKKAGCLLQGHFHLGGGRDLFREGDGTPLQYFCLENPMDGGAW